MTPSDLRAWREKHGLTQKQAAHMMGVALRTWQYWETGERKNPGKLLLRAIRDAERELAEDRARGDTDTGDRR